jgi:16S rRNA (cytosine967-C5)-methyltransferase
MGAEDNPFPNGGQQRAIRWMTRYLRAPAKIGDTREADGPGGGAERRRAIRLQTGAIRNLRLYRHVLDQHLRQRPAAAAEAVLLLALAESDHADQPAAVRPRLVHSWVDRAREAGLSAGSVRLVNAVLRRATPTLARIRERPGAVPEAVLTSHPDWLVERWRARWGAAETSRLLRWDQGTPGLYAHGPLARPEDAPGLPGSLQPTGWPGFYRLPEGIPPSVQEGLRAGTWTIRDPATRIAVEATLARPAERILDLCASPGGKSRGLLADPRAPRSLLAADLPDRLGLLRDNLAPWPGQAEVRAVDLDEESPLADERLAFDAVLLDAPCSNTGVLQRRPDVRWRLRPDDLEALPPRQIAYLRRAAALVAPGGTLVYSTCSLEPEENREVVDAFLAAEEGRSFRLETAVLARPTRTGHDGAGVYRLVRERARKP